MNYQELEKIIHNAFLSEKPLSQDLIYSVDETISLLDKGAIRVCEKEGDSWKVNKWIKEAILLSFKIRKLSVIKAGDLNFFDKIPLKKWSKEDGVRVVPHALVRQGAFIEKGAILMPSYTNIGAYVGSGTMVDTWATVGSCAQIGRNVHLSGGVGIGGVLEPIQGSPVIIEDDVFIGSRCIVVEGVRVKKGAVLGASVVLTASTKIIDVTKDKDNISRGVIEENSVVIPGSVSKTFHGGEFFVPCALVIGKRSESTNKKTSLTEALRNFKVSV